MPAPSPPCQATLGKLRRPRLGRVFDRTRLFADLDAAASAPGTWISGPPGMGKTTLVATYLQAAATPCLWLQLDPGDADPATFVHFLLAAAAAAQSAPPAPSAPQDGEPAAAPGVPQATPPTPGPPPAPPTPDDLRDMPAYLRRLFRRLVPGHAQAWALVLDNAQALGQGGAVHAGLAAVLAELAPQARLLFISREPPPDAYAHALAGQQLVLIDERQLRFSAADTARLLALHGRDWSADALQQATDGWAAAMILLLATRTEPTLDAALRGGTARGQLFALFAGEVLAAMPASHAAALLRIALLPSASVPMAVAISGDAQAGDLLADLTRRSLFTERRDGTPPVYTLHALFSEFLRARAAQQLAPAALLALRVAAARLLAANGQADAAIRTLLDAQAWDDALALLASHAGQFVAQGRTAMLRDSLLALPQPLHQRPDVAYWLGCCLLASDPALALQQFQLAAGDAANGAAAAAATPAAPALTGQAAFHNAAAAADAIVSIGANLHALDRWLPLLHSHAAAYLAQADEATDLRVLPGLLSAFVHRDTGHALTAPLADRAERLLDRPLGASQRLLLGTLAYHLLWTGQLQRLDRIMRKLDSLCLGQDTGPDSGHPTGPGAAPGTLLRWYGVSVLVRALLGRVDEALQHATQALALAEAGPAGGAAPQRAKAHLLMVLAAVAGRDRALARAHLHSAAGLLDADNAIDATTYAFQRGMLMLLDADWTGADQLMRVAVASGRASGWPLREHIALLGATLAASQVGDADRAEATLQAVLRHPFYKVCVWHHWLAGLIEAHLALQRGQQGRALAALQRAFAIGQAHGFDFGPMPFACGDMMPRLAALALAHGIQPAFARHLISRHALPAPPGAGELWPWPVRIHLLGGFRITLAGAPAPPARKESRKPQDLLKLLLVLAPAGGGAVPVDRLCHALWPDAEGDAARNAFDNTLHRLRKLLGAERLLLQAGGLALDTGSCWADLAALQAALAALDSLPGFADVTHADATHAEINDADVNDADVNDADATPAAATQAAAADAAVAALLALAQQVLTLYRGPLLAGEDSLPDVLAARARAEASVVRHLSRAGARLQAASRPADAARLYQRVLEQQPAAEDVCRQLMRCFITLGRRAEALGAYQRCRQHLALLLQLRPMPETEALADTIRNL